MAQYYVPPIFESIQSLDISDQELLLLLQKSKDEGIDIGALKDSNGNNALHYCALYNRGLVVVQWLIALAPFSVYDRNVAGLNILFAAANYSQLEVISFLALQYPDLASQLSSHGTTIAHSAVAGYFIQDEPLASLCLPYINQPDYTGVFPIHVAAQVGNSKALHWLLEHGADLHTHTLQDDLSVLDMAMRSGNTELLDFLKNEFDLNKPNAQGFYPIQFAATDHPDSLVWFLNQGFSADWKNDMNVTLVHSAASFNNTVNLELLKSKGANINIPNNKGWFPIHFAAQSGAVEALNWLINQGVDPSLKISGDIANTPLEIAVLNNQTAILDALFTLGISMDNPRANNWYPIHLSVYQECFKAFIWLIDKGVDINALQENDVGETPVMAALLLNDLTFLRALYLCGADINKPNLLGIFPIHMASYSNPNSFRWLLEKGISPELKQQNHEEYQPVHLAAMLGTAEFLNILADYNANLIAEDATGLQAIHYASKRTDGNGALLKWFVDHGVDVNAVATKDYGNKPVHYAAINDAIANLEVLNTAGADVNSPNATGLYPIHLASYHNNVRTVKWLLMHGAIGDQWENNENGETPAHYAAQRNHVEILQMLYDHGIDVNKINKYESTPFEQAVHLGNQHVINWYFAKKIITRN